jgi:hypothetical protein
LNNGFTDIPAEWCLLGSIVREPELLPRIPHAGIFSDDRCRIVYNALRDLQDRNIPLDPLTLTKALSLSDTVLKHPGGIGAITAEMNANASGPNVAAHCVETLCELRIKRMAHKAIAAAQSSGDPLAELEKLSGVLEQLRAEKISPIQTLLAQRRFDIHNPPPAEPVVFSLGETEICHAGSITTIEAHQKSGKSAFVAAGIASTFAPEGADTLGWRSANVEGRAVLHIDTEQSRGDHYNLMRRALAIAGANEPVPWLQSYCLTGCTCAELRMAITYARDEATRNYSGVHSLILDGVGDVVVNLNDPDESFEFVAWLQSLAIRGAFPILGVLHLNPGDSGKSRGHLGSQLNRKSEHVLRLTKGADEVTTVTTQWSRRAPIPRDQTPSFAWSAEHSRHVTVANAAKGQTDDKRESIADLAAECLRGSREIGLTWDQLHEAIRAKEDCSLSTARRRFDDMKKFKVIGKFGEKYRLK